MVLQRIIYTKIIDVADAALFYGIFTYVFHLTITWPVVLAVAWSVDGFNGSTVRKHFKREKRKQAEALLKNRRVS